MKAGMKAGETVARDELYCFVYVHCAKSKGMTAQTVPMPKLLHY